jgi:hypothetical protein
MSARLRTSLILAAAGLGLSACAYDDGYGYGGLSVGYGGYGGYGGYCDPYYEGCYSGYGYGYGDPWYGWYGDYYYPGIGIYVFDRHGRRHRWSDNDRRYWEGRRGHWQGRDWNDHRWERWDGYRGDRRDGRRGEGDRSGWQDRSQRQEWNENPRLFRREGMRQRSTEPRVQSDNRVRTEGARTRGEWRGRSEGTRGEWRGRTEGTRSRGEGGGWRGRRGG